MHIRTLLVGAPSHSLLALRTTHTTYQVKAFSPRWRSVALNVLSPHRSLLSIVLAKLDIYGHRP